MGFIKHVHCIKCTSSDGLAVAVDSDGVLFGKCMVCGKGFSNNKILKHRPEFVDLGYEFIDFSEEKEDEYVGDEMAEVITKEEREYIESVTSNKSRGFRGIRDEISNFFGVRFDVDETDASVLKVLYPVTIDYKLSGYKYRNVATKDFYSKCKTGSDCDLFGAFRFKNGGKTVVLVGGEHDQLAAYQMLKDSTKDNFEPPAVLSPTVGETGCKKQIQNNYKLLDKFDKIILGFDQDEAGLKAMDEIAPLLPHGKVFIAHWPSKDPNDCLREGKQQAFVNAYWSAKKWVGAGVSGSNTLYDKVISELRTEKIPLPPFMEKLEDMMAGGIPLGRIINIGAASGSGKTTVINEMIYHWIFHSPHLVGVVSLELDQGQYGVEMLSRHLNNKIMKIKDPEEAVKFVQLPENRDKAEELFSNPDGSPRWLLVDDREGTIKSLQKTTEEMIIAGGVKVVVYDPLQDVLDGLSNEEQAVFMRWQKQTVKRYGITIVNINHVRKSGSGEKQNSEGKDLTEEDFQGSSAIFKSGAANILFSRNKYSEDPVERNTITARASKIRWTGETGPCGTWFYDFKTSRMHDKERYFENKLDQQIQPQEAQPFGIEILAEDIVDEESPV